MADTYQRKCENWISAFGAWALPKSEAPETFVFWTGLFTLACAVRRQVYVPKTMLGSWEASPNLYIMFIGQAGKVRKSTTVNYTEELIDEVSPQVPKSPELITKESLLSTLANSIDSSMYIVAPEFGEFIVKSGLDMYGFLTNAYDGKRRISVSTLSRGVEFAERPCVNLIGATTPEWVAANMPESVIGGGFASRVIFIHEKAVRRRKLFYDDLNHEELEQLRLMLVDDLSHIATIRGEFKPENNETRDWLEQWYQTTADKYSEAEYKMHGFFERLPAHVLKVAQLLHLAYSDELVLTIKDFQQAIELLKIVEKGLPSVFQAIGKNPYTVDMNRIMAFIVEKGKVAKSEIYRNFYHAATPQMLNELLDGLYDMGKISQQVTPTETIISPRLLVSTPAPDPEPIRAVG